MMTVSKAAAWIVLAAFVAVALPASAPRAQNSIERRLAAAHRYAMVADIPNLICGLARQLALNFPPKERSAFMDFMTGLDIVRLEVALVDAMVKHFTAAELEALAGFYGAPLGKSILRKMPVYMGEVMPAINEIMMERVEMYDR
jgi:hypothetical protein